MMGFNSMRNLVLLFAIFDVIIGIKFTLVIPKVLYYDSHTVAVVSASDIRPNHNASVTLEYRGVKNSRRILNSTKLDFSSDGSQSWTVIFTWDYLQQFGEHKVELVMSSDNEIGRMTLPFSQNFGYIFIQTDKPIYTPEQTVKFRIIAVDERQRLAKYKIKIDIKNHKQVIIDRSIITAEEAFRTQEFKLPKETPPGNWSITASFKIVDQTYGDDHTVTFEVKEYVLPRFYTNVQISPDVVTKSTTQITVNGSAKYFYDKDVVGTVDVQLGTWDAKNGVQLFDKHYIKDVTGVFTEIISVDDLFLQWEFPRDSRLYVKVNFTETVTSEHDIYVDTSTYISNSDYVVSFEGSKSYFKPGFPYTLQLKVSHRNGDPTSLTNIPVKFQFFAKENKLFQERNDIYWLIDQDDKGNKRNTDIMVPEETENISILVTIEHQMVHVSHVHRVTKYLSPNNEYIHISLVDPHRKNGHNKKKRKDDDLIIYLTYTKPANSNLDGSSTQDSITVLVLAKGQIVFTANAARMPGRSTSTIQLPSHLYAEVSPRMRIIAYYYVPNRSEEYVIDSLVVDTKQVCIEEIYLTAPPGSKLYKPYESYDLRIDGSPNMYVGLAAIDSAVLHLNRRQTLTRNLMFAELGSHDEGTASGDGSSMENILNNSGLQYMSLNVVAQYNLRDIFPLYEKEPVMARQHGMESSHEAVKSVHSRETDNTIRPQTKKQKRDYFPESWLFTEMQLPSNGSVDLNLTLPDSVTDWSFLAVGISANRGICVSPPLQQSVMKLFFADVRLPYKVKRLEEVTLSITVYNYHGQNLTVTVYVTGAKELCFLGNIADSVTQSGINFTTFIHPKQSVGKTIKLIPLHNGDHKVTVHITGHHEHDIVEKTLHVVPEGQKVKKSITFVLDPEAKRATINPTRQRRTLPQSSTVTNVYDLKNKKQHTTIDLALPAEVITGTEFCSISAFGDLMGDIINSSVVESKIFDTPLDAEEVLGDLAPTVYALKYANFASLMDEKLREKGRKFVRHGVARLLKYRLDNYSFTLTPESKPATWLTAFALKTLCHASSLAFIDRENLIDTGFYWLLEQVNQNGTLNEQDLRLAKDSLEYRIVLSADVLIAILECNKSEKENHLALQGAISTFLEENLDHIKEPTVLAKVTYALMLFDSESDEYKASRKRLDSMKRKNKQGQLYWSNLAETEESNQIPVWYHRGAQASAIEATAYALNVYIHHGDPNVEAIADWLVGQRKRDGAFIGAMDSTVAIQALSSYSLQKHKVKVDLCCNVSSDRQKAYFHSFKFTEKNATHPKSLNNVPVGQVLDVLTKGQGLGQMQVNVEYNIPIVKNVHCPFKIVAKATKTEAWSAKNSNPLCASCKAACPSERKIAARVRVKLDKAVLNQLCSNNDPLRRPGSICKRPQKQRKRSSGKKEKLKEIAQNLRQARSVQDNLVASKKSICIHVCLQHTKRGSAGPTEVRIEMLTGYRPALYDIEKIMEMPNVRNAMFDNVTEVLRVQFNEISCRRKTCLTFRALVVESVDRLMPAIVEVIKIGTNAPQCVTDYAPPPGEKNLHLYCADSSNSNKGECKCLSGFCSLCKTFMKDDYILSEIENLACRTKVAYQVQLGQVTSNDLWSEIDAKVMSLNRTGLDNITEGSIIKLTTPNFCKCPVPIYQNNTERVYMLADNVEKLVDRKGNEMYRYLLDEQSIFVKIEERGMTDTSVPTVLRDYLHQVLLNHRKCPS